MFLPLRAERNADKAAISAGFGGIAFLASIIGTALSLGTYEKRLSMPPSAWVAIIGNVAILLVWFALILVRAMQ